MQIDTDIDKIEMIKIEIEIMRETETKGRKNFPIFLIQDQCYYISISHLIYDYQNHIIKIVKAKFRCSWVQPGKWKTYTIPQKNLNIENWLHKLWSDEQAKGRCLNISEIIMVTISYLFQNWRHKRIHWGFSKIRSSEVRFYQIGAQIFEGEKCPGSYQHHKNLKERQRHH